MVLWTPLTWRSVAQLVEHRSPKPGAGGSSPSTPAKGRLNLDIWSKMGAFKYGQS